MVSKGKRKREKPGKTGLLSEGGKLMRRYKERALFSRIDDRSSFFRLVIFCKVSPVRPASILCRVYR
ncbi:hypothetical protein ED312_03680 [Sinomicrobium pectinilyticum]|uniref:Uncharacterized protein n=1 Tax=Sinomicrobium pectinilyticum TaxID=1084421 RepID=A0A3N0EWL3_SINP1|nr:hypothetical protein ED312_03680 [Sinomicrobium pectinilyticum]